MSRKTLVALTLATLALAALTSYLALTSHGTGDSPASVEPRDAAQHARAALDRSPTGGAASRADVESHPSAASPVAGAVPSPSPQGLESCLLLADADEVTACLDEWLASRPFPAAEREIGSSICFVNSTAGAPFGTAELTLAIASTLRARASTDIVASIEAFREACPRAATFGCIERAVMGMRDADLDLFEHVRQSLVGESVFDPTSGDAAIRLAVFLADVLDDARLQQLVLDGARGELGGTDAQTDFAALASLRYLERGDASLAWAEELLAAPFLSDGTGRSDLGSNSPWRSPSCAAGTPP